MADKRFSFVTEGDVQKVRDNRTPANTIKHTRWSTNVYKEWAKARNTEFRDFEAESQVFKRVPDLQEMSIEEINHWFSRLTLEVRKRNGKEYRHEVLYSLFCGLNRTVQLQYPKLNLFNSAEFKALQQTLDGKLKELQSTQNPMKKRADAVTVSDERGMWNDGILGTSCPTSVINTLVFLTGKMLALRGGKEQRELTHEQFEFVEQTNGKMVLKYVEKVSKTNQGGLKRRKQETKRVEHVEDPLHEESFSFIYNFYVFKW